jgi:glycine cleavage system aminomethyltransferase T
MKGCKLTDRNQSRRLLPELLHTGALGAGGVARRQSSCIDVALYTFGEGQSILNLEGKEIDAITSGSAARFLKNNIAFALVVTQAAATSEDGLVQLHQKQILAKQGQPPITNAQRSRAFWTSKPGRLSGKL